MFSTTCLYLPMFPDFMYILQIINIVNKNKSLAILEAFLMFCVLGLKKKQHIFYDGISVFINKTSKFTEKEIILTFLTQYWFHKP